MGFFPWIARVLPAVAVVTVLSACAAHAGKPLPAWGEPSITSQLPLQNGKMLMLPTIPGWDWTGLGDPQVRYLSPGSDNTSDDAFAIEQTKKPFTETASTLGDGLPVSQRWSGTTQCGTKMTMGVSGADSTPSVLLDAGSETVSISFFPGIDPSAGQYHAISSDSVFDFFKHICVK